MCLSTWSTVLDPNPDLHTFYCRLCCTTIRVSNYRPCVCSSSTVVFSVMKSTRSFEPKLRDLDGYRTADFKEVFDNCLYFNVRIYSQNYMRKELTTSLLLEIVIHCFIASIKQEDEHSDIYDTCNDSNDDNDNNSDTIISNTFIIINNRIYY